MARKGRPAVPLTTTALRTPAADTVAGVALSGGVIGRTAAAAGAAETLCQSPASSAVRGQDRLSVDGRYGRGMNTIYVHGSACLGPGAADRLAHLAEAGDELVLVAPADHPLAGGPVWVAQLPSVPEQPSRGSWFITADPATCGDRQAGLRTMLIGPREAGQRPTRCDVHVRDLREGVLEILAHDAMA